MPERLTLRLAQNIGQVAKVRGRREAGRLWGHVRRNRAAAARRSGDDDAAGGRPRPVEATRTGRRAAPRGGGRRPGRGGGGTQVPARPLRIALHTGEAHELEGGRLAGPAVRKCQRLCEIANGGQTLRSTVTASASVSPTGPSWRRSPSPAWPSAADAAPSSKAQQPRTTPRGRWRRSVAERDRADHPRWKMMSPPNTEGGSGCSRRAFWRKLMKRGSRSCAECSAMLGTST